MLVAGKWIMTRGAIYGLYQFRYSELGRNILAPFDPFGRTITAAGPADLMAAGGEAALIDLGLLFVVILLDANYMEAAMSASRRRYANPARIRGGSLLSSSVRGNVNWRLPRFPSLGGVGPIAWRQATSAAARSAKGLMLVLLLISTVVGPMFGTALRGQDVDRIPSSLSWDGSPSSSPGPLKFDFRGDLDHIDQLKAMPLRPSILSIGQLNGPRPPFSLPRAHRPTPGPGGNDCCKHVQHSEVVLSDFWPSTFNFGADGRGEHNFPSSSPAASAAASPGDFQVLRVGKWRNFSCGQSLFLTGLAIALLLALPGFMVSEGSLTLLTVVAFIVLLGEGIGMVLVMGWAFKRYDQERPTQRA